MSLLAPLPPKVAHTPPGHRVLMIDVGGSNVKLMVTGNDEMRKFPSSRVMTAREMVENTKALTADWDFDAVTLGYPGLVKEGRLVREPLNLGGSWMTFDFEKAFKRPVRIINDAALQALSVYHGGRMLFIGFGTSIGACLIADDVIVPIETGLISFRNGNRFMERLTKAMRKEKGQEKWQRYVVEAVALLRDVFYPDDTVIGGGNAKHIDPFPEGCRRSNNENAFKGATRLWEGNELLAIPYGSTWRIHWPAQHHPVGILNGTQAKAEGERPLKVAP